MGHHSSDDPVTRTIRDLRQDPAFVRLERLCQVLHHSQKRWRRRLESWLQQAGRSAAELPAIVATLEGIIGRTKLEGHDLHRLATELLLPFLDEAETSVAAPRLRRTPAGAGKKSLPTGLAEPAALPRTQPLVVYGGAEAVRSACDALLLATADTMMEDGHRRLRVLYCCAPVPGLKSVQIFRDRERDQLTVRQPEWDALITNEVRFRQQMKEWQVQLKGPPDLFLVDDITYCPTSAAAADSRKIGGRWRRALDAVARWPRLVRPAWPALLWGLISTDPDELALRQLSEKVQLYQARTQAGGILLDPASGSSFLLETEVAV